MPRVVVPTESDERAASQSHRRRKLVAAAVALLCLAAVAAFALKTWRDRARKANAADTAFVSVPAWPRTEARPLAPKPTLAAREYLLQLGTYTSKRDAEELQGRLAGLAWPVSIVVPVSATDSLNKVIVSGIEDKATARHVADSLGAALHLRVTIIEPTGTRSK
jgi:cell division protein FtsN